MTNLDIQSNSFASYCDTWSPAEIRSVLKQSVLENIWTIARRSYDFMTLTLYNQPLLEKKKEWKTTLIGSLSLEKLRSAELDKTTNRLVFIDNVGTLCFTLGCTRGMLKTKGSYKAKQN